jgi:hypothetical protein
LREALWRGAAQRLHLTRLKADAPVHDVGAGLAEQLQRLFIAAEFDAYFFEQEICVR